MRCLVLCTVAVNSSACSSSSQGNAQESSAAEREPVEEFNSGRDPANFPSTYGLIIAQAKLTTGDRLRKASLRAIHKFDRDYVVANIPILDFVPGTPSGSYATGLETSWWSTCMSFLTCLRGPCMG
jgi:hypothetical protein